MPSQGCVMPSPFPGMNPYLEQDRVWSDFHQAFCTSLRERLVPQVRPEFFVKLEEHLYIHQLTTEERVRIGRADVAVARPGEASGHPPSSIALLEPPLEVEVPIATDVERIPYIEIVDRRDQSVVTVIELLSPTNKRPGCDRDTFVLKRQRLLASTAHYIEIDLLRGGPRLPFKDPPDCDYYVLVSRAERRPRLGMWPLKLRDRLPEIPIPVREPHPDARIDLQTVLNRVYDAAGYEDYLYAGRPQPRLQPDDEAWAGSILAGLRPPPNAS
jgi:Protein of unknown function (DUF4058)